MLHAYAGTTETTAGEVGFCVCGWRSLPRRRPAGGVDAVLRHRDRLGGEPLHMRTITAAHLGTAPLPPGVHSCEHCGRPFPVRVGPGRYPKRCDECRLAVA